MVVNWQIATDVVGLVDEWAARFFEELDYIHEGENATRFAASMAVDLPQVWPHLNSLIVIRCLEQSAQFPHGFGCFSSIWCALNFYSLFLLYLNRFVSVLLCQVVVPKTYTKYTSRRVLTSEWIDGEKLSQSQASDVGNLVNIGVICYLKQVRSLTLILSLLYDKKKRVFCFEFKVYKFLIISMIWFCKSSSGSPSGYLQNSCCIILSC